MFVLPAFETYGVTHEAAAVADMLASQDKVRRSSCARAGLPPLLVAHRGVGMAR